ncbi:MAG: hypothetical protein OEV08_09185, partial [Nitrospira sp.]|nr:hypothetical protein [Nitrospira sp.]
FRLAAPLSGEGASDCERLRLLTTPQERMSLLGIWRLLRWGNTGRLLRALTLPRVKKLVIVDHDMGGGANQYRRQILSGAIAAGKCVIVLTNQPTTLQYVLEIHLAAVTSRYLLNSLEEAISHLDRWPLDEVVYNNAVSFDSPETLVEWMSTLAENRRIALTMVIHDYYSICPSPFLLDPEARFCGIPSDLDVCRSCLPRNREKFLSLCGTANIVEWRKGWEKCLLTAKKTVCFSRSSYTLIRRAYPWIDSETIEVTPHQVAAFPGGRPQIDLAKPLHLGILGSIGIHKGAAVVSQLAGEIIRRGLPIRISVIGTIELACDPTVISQTGPYHRDQLPGLIEDVGANVFLFPSICPETFSYAVHELVELQVPVACFDLGAPADRIRSYEYGKIVPIGNASDILDALLEFHASLSSCHLARKANSNPSPMCPRAASSPHTSTGHST